MGIIIVLFLCNLLIPAIMILAGFFMLKFPPKDINGFMGYRTTMSKKNKDTWDFAHRYCGKLWFILGIILLIPSVAIQVPMIPQGESFFGNFTLILEGIQLVVLLLTIIPVEKALKKTFDENGNRR